jgi:predicted RNA-binding Zn-ribbon protein involved in translation (DUF1610 family)
LAKSISDAAWGEFRRWVEYFGKVFGVATVAVAPQYTSQTCSNCGEGVKKLLSTRTHVCPHCGHVQERDHNAAINILKKGLSTVGHTGINAWGENDLYLNQAIGSDKLFGETWSLRKQLKCLKFSPNTIQILSCPPLIPHHCPIRFPNFRDFGDRHSHLDPHGFTRHFDSGHPDRETRLMPKPGVIAFVKAGDRPSSTTCARIEKSTNL